MTVPSVIAEIIGPLLSYRMHRRIIVFESDDWGSVRMPSKYIWGKIKNAGFAVEHNNYESNDAIESLADIKALSDTLSEFTNCKGDHPLFTLNYAVCNPDFEKIRQSSYQQYYYEPFIETFKRVEQTDYPLHLLNNKNSLLCSQFHCREHFNVDMWMTALREDVKDMRWLMDLGCVGTHMDDIVRNPYVVAYDYQNETGKNFVAASIADGLKIFQGIFGIRSKSVIAPNYLWSDDFLPIFKEHGVIGLQGCRFQRLPGNGHKRKFHWTGERSYNHLLYSVRNCVFEPTVAGDNAVRRCMDGIRKSFLHNIPAVICSHRINYISRIRKENQIYGISQLRSLLRAIVQEWPDVEFMTSPQLFDVIAGNDEKNTDI